MAQKYLSTKCNNVLNNFVSFWTKIIWIMRFGV